MLARMTTDPTDTRWCPLGVRCESCGTAGTNLAVVVRHAFGEALCLTLCPPCAATERIPAIQLSTAIKLVAQHVEHLTPVGERWVTVLPRVISYE